MAVLTLTSDQLAPTFRRRPIDEHGKLRYIYFAITLAAQADITSTIDLAKLPPGPVRLLPYMCYHIHSAWGASATINVGYRAFNSRPPNLGVQAESATALVTGLTMVSALTTPGAMFTTLKYDFFSLEGVTLFATVTGANAPAAATFSGFFAYLHE